MRVKRVRQLDHGGQGTVWLVEDVETGIEYALKYLKPAEDAADPEAVVRRFVREVRVQSELKHDGIVGVVAMRLSDDPPWYCMPLADESLRKRLSQSSDGLGEDEALRVTASVIRAMQYAHSEGVTHRDLKPENVLFYGEDVRVSDFGLSRQFASNSTTITHANIALGTIQYGAPEQFVDAHGADGRADVYAIGKLLYEMLCGKIPFPYFKLDNVPDRYRFVIGRCTEEDPDRRYQSLDDLARDLAMLQSGANDLRAPVEMASSALDAVVAGAPDGIEQLSRVLVEHADDAILYLNFVAYLSTDVIMEFAAADRDGLRTVYSTFARHAEGRHAFSFVDTIANFLSSVFAALPELTTRKAIVEQVLRVGYDHNRYYVREVFVALLVALASTEPGALAAAEILRSVNRDVLDWVQPSVRTVSLPAHVRRELTP